MPFQSEKQRRYLHANHPEIANRWEAKYGLGGIAELNSQLNQLPEYYLPKNQGGRIGFDTGTPKDFQKFLNERNEAVGEENLDRLMEDYKRWLKGQSPQIEEAAHGGFIPSHEAGIYGLAEGGKIIDGQPHQLSYITPGEAQSLQNLGGRKVMTSEGIPAYPPQGQSAQHGGTESHTSSSTGGGDAGHLSHNVSVSHGGTKADPTPKDEPDGRSQALINISKQKKKPTYTGTEDLEEQLVVDKQNALNRLKHDPNLTKNERQSLEVGLGLRTPKKGKTIGNYAVSLLTTVLTGGIKNPLTSYAANKIIKYGADKIGLDDMITSFVDENIDFSNLSMDNVKLKIDQKKAEKDLIASLPKGHPERIQLEGLKKETITPDGPDGNGVETSIKIENIEEVNDDKTQLLKKYEEMDEASLLAWQRQQEMQAKKQAYLRNFRNTYMSAQGGRVPAGYNTGGLSNLFRLKNV